MIHNLFKRKPKLVFVYAEEFKNSGTSIMRGYQLSEIVQKNLSELVDTKYAPFSVKFRSSILLLTKGVLKTATPSELSGLARRGNVLIFDPVDEFVPSELLPYADVILAASKVADVKYRELYPGKQIYLLNHHVDPRLPKGKKRTAKIGVPSFGYFGELVNSVSDKKIRELVDFHQVDTSSQDPSWMNQLNDYEVHYAVRKNIKSFGYKPFLEGFTAAHCNAVVMIQETELEAVLWLGEDYPYLLRGPVNTGSIVEMINSIKKSYNKSDGKKARDKMQILKKQTSLSANISELQNLITIALNQL